MKNKVINAIVGIAIVVVILVVSIFYMSAPNDNYIQGQVEARQINVSSKIPGRIDDILVEEGDKVEEGQVLAKISTPEIDAKLIQAESLKKAASAIDTKINKGARQEEIQMAFNIWQQAKAAVELAEKTYARVENLYNEKVIPAQQKDEVETKLKAARESEKTALAAYTMVKKGLRPEDKQAALAVVDQTQGAVDEVLVYKSEGHVKAPQAGEIAVIMPNKGEIVNSGYPIVNLVDLNDIWVNFNIREDLMNRFKMHSEFDAIIPALGNEKVRFQVRFIAVQGDYATWSATKTKGDFDMKTFQIKAYPTTKVDGLRPGMSVLVLEKSLK